MKLLYTRENRYLVYNIQNVIENSGIETMLKNEYAIGAVGDLAPHESWLELWLVNDDDYDEALDIINNTLKNSDPDWVCSKCNEVNAASFEFCWKCHTSHD
jgi:hypothetical protein